MGIRTKPDDLEAHKALRAHDIHARTKALKAMGTLDIDDDDGRHAAAQAFGTGPVRSAAAAAKTGPGAALGTIVHH